MSWWSQLDPNDVQRDLERVAATGMDSVRLFLLWEAFQPSSDGVDREMLARRSGRGTSATSTRTAWCRPIASTRGAGSGR